MRNKKVVSVICVVLAFLMLMSLVVSALVTMVSASQADIDVLEEKKSALRDEREQMQANIDALENEKADVLTRKAALDERNELARQEIELIDEQIEMYSGLIDLKAKELDEAIEAEEEQHRLFVSHMTLMEENGKYTYLDLLFQCRSLSQLLSAIDDISEIMSADKRLYDDYTASREKTQEVKEEYERTLAELGDKQEELKSQKSELEAEIEEAVALIVSLQEDIDKAREEYLANEAAEAALQAELDAIAAELARQEEEARRKAAEEAAAAAAAAAQNQSSGGSSAPVYSGIGSTATGSYIWPCPSTTIVTSPYGWRIHPIFGTERFHSGIDIGAASGAVIVAADSGTVSVATYSSSYGNYVMIYHSSGEYTLYAHMSSLTVSAGDSVTQGDTIGYAGSTGWATGPHLHFEIRVNGSTVDPLGYFSNYTIVE